MRRFCVVYYAALIRCSKKHWQAFAEYLKTMGKLEQTALQVQNTLFVDGFLHGKRQAVTMSIG